MREYNFKSIEKKWQDKWEEEDIYKTEERSEKEKFYCLDFFPYPSGDGLHVGHCRNYIPTDVISRCKRMKGFNVLHPMGWDAFGLPAENDAILKKKNPKENTANNVNNFRRQLKLLGTSYDWSREINSTDPEYYKWTQYFFLLLYKKGLAYEDYREQWWCPSCKTILANEQVEDGKCWRCGSTVTKKKLKQWFFKITDYADRLVDDLDTIDWPERIKLMQKNWIGRSSGAEVIFKIESAKSKELYDITIFTTRLDTIFGSTFLVLAPEHPLVHGISGEKEHQLVDEYIEEAKRKSEIERMKTEKDKTGVFTGAYAINPYSNEKIPVFIADYVLSGYGTGAIMAVPAHDSRDFEFAKKFNIPIRQVINTDIEWDVNGWKDDYTSYGVLVNSGKFSGLSSEGAIKAMLKEGNGFSKETINYHLRDWLISRQRYWGAPIPMIHCEKCGTVPVPDRDLPVFLPDVESYIPTDTGESPLANIEEWVNTTCPVCGGKAKRETDTMDGFACSSWYFLRFADSQNKKEPFSKEKVSYWLPVDLYVGGAEHAVMHLLYARFWVKVMYDAGLVPFNEPFAKLMNQGMLISYDGQRMSKSRHNVITPDEIAEKYGADSLRVYELFMAPFEQEVAWSQEGIQGASRFVKRVWDIVLKTIEAKDKTLTDKTVAKLQNILNKTIKKISDDIEKFKFNTAVSTLMEFSNFLWEKFREDETVLFSEEWQDAIKKFLIIFAPFAPHLTEELWRDFSFKTSIHKEKWPEYDKKFLEEDTVDVVIQVNGKLRDKITIEKYLNDEEVKNLAVASDAVKKYIEGKNIKKVVVIKNKLVNIVV